MKVTLETGDEKRPADNDGPFIPTTTSNSVLTHEAREALLERETLEPDEVDALMA